MNKVFACLFVISTTCVQAQNYKPFKVNLSLGLASPAGKGLSNGFLVGVEPKYALSSHIDLGLRLESAVLVRSVTWGSGGSANPGNVSTRNSAVLTATYLFNSIGQYTLRPFVGIGLGLFVLPSAGTVRVEQNQTIVQLPVSEYSGFGGVIRGGIKIGHFVASLEYNPVPTHVYTLSDVNFDSRGSYTSLRLGIDIGGGPKVR